MNPQFMTGVFTLAGVALTAGAALIAAWLKYRLDRTVTSRNDLREVLVRAIATGQEFDDLLILAHKSAHVNERIKEIQTELHSLYRKLRIIFSKLTLLTFSGDWYPYFNEMRVSYQEEKYLAPGFEDTHSPAVQAA
jgi:hypothetical protein